MHFSLIISVAFSEVVKAEPKPVLNVAKPQVTLANTPVTPQTSTQLSTETPQDPSSNPDVATPKGRNEDMKDLKDFSVNFKVCHIYKQINHH